MNLKISSQSFIVGSTLASLALTSQAASAITLTSDPSGEGWVDLEWAIEGRAGASGGADYEFAIGPNGAQADNTGQIYRDWNNGEELPWLLTWNSETATVLFTLDNESIAYSIFDPVSTVFDGFFLQTKARTQEGFVDPGTSMFFSVTTVNGEEVTPVFSESIAPDTDQEQDLNTFYFSSDETIVSLAGIATMNWDDSGLNPNVASARSRVTFLMRGFNTQTTVVDSVPEPSGMLALFSFGLTVLTIKRRKRI